MSIYLGSKGQIKIKRKFGSTDEDPEFSSVIKPDDIETAKKRFSFDFPHNLLVSGDEVTLTSTNSAVLGFVATAGWSNATKQTSGSWYIHVDDLGGVRLYDNFGHAMNGGSTNAIALEAIGADIPITVKVENADYRILGQVTDYQLNTNRETIDVTSIGQEFRKSYSSLMSGSGRVQCFWDYKDSVAGGNYEVGHYLAQLALRARVGSAFDAQLFIKNAGYNPSGGTDTSDDMVWYEVYGILTSCAVAFSTDNLVRMTADFITTGEIKLMLATEAEFKVLQEDSGMLRGEKADEEGNTVNLLLTTEA